MVANDGSVPSYHIAVMGGRARPKQYFHLKKPGTCAHDLHISLDSNLMLVPLAVISRSRSHYSRECQSRWTRRSYLFTVSHVMCVESVTVKLDRIERIVVTNKH